MSTKQVISSSPGLDFAGYTAACFITRRSGGCGTGRLRLREHSERERALRAIAGGAA